MYLVEVNGLPLPPLLLKLIEQNQWKRPEDTAVLAELTGSERADEFDFLTIESMRRETSGNHHLANDEKLAHIYALASSKHMEAPMEDSTVLDVDYAVIIAMNWDEEAICLDYRTSPDNPRVMMCQWGDEGARWKVIAPDFTSFVLYLGL
ncbi:MAG: SMI1/KNR4 family protein [Chloroflexi bacterium]|nr:SMI1/KNR4 family protein [Chloroflexota bacterium]MCI0576180.1 SMI1/KNR4 family protein [Chloroflexota bacterium]MCI0648967.1 SMI1/KNR4 family protein [Chloroflexota bacterium]MCI0728183.1 SMI1/KNR4 family protein [Chloroflexota bacterium]